MVSLLYSVCNASPFSMALQMGFLQQNLQIFSNKQLLSRQFRAVCRSLCIDKYSRLSLSRPRLSRTTTYLEEKIWSMLKSNIR